MEAPEQVLLSRKVLILNKVFITSCIWLWHCRLRSLMESMAITEHIFEDALLQLHNTLREFLVRSHLQIYTEHASCQNYLIGFVFLDFIDESLNVIEASRSSYRVVDESRKSQLWVVTSGAPHQSWIP